MWLAQILGELRNGGLVQSRRGKQGGYLLGRPPEEISFFEIIALIQGAHSKSEHNVMPNGRSRHFLLW